ncbi:hypothetical protein EfmAA55_12950 [Enterococcus faecium]|nr:hypothetical protein EfmAA55_12950 [Enterococcus faecium]
MVVDAVLSPTPRACRSCGSTVVDGNGKAIIVKNGKKETIVRFDADNFPDWSEQSNGIATANTWVALVDKGLGANLQHYNQSQIMLDIKLLLY